MNARAPNDYPQATRLADRADRRARARRILAVLEEFAGQDLARATLLDVGASHGLIAATLAERVECTVGMDVDADALDAARAERGDATGLAFVRGSGMDLPFKDECVDIVVCNHVYEHVPDAPRLLREIARVLRPGGACYFAGGHSLQLVEPHYRIPFLSWLPRPWAGAVLRATGRGEAYREAFLPPWRVRTLFTPFAEARDVTGEVLRRCHRYGLGPRWLERVFGRWLPSKLAAPVARLLPTQLWVLRK
jgi:SAM-dependent methyltransferase